MYLRVFMVKLTSKCPIDTGNMVGHIYEPLRLGTYEASVTIAAPAIKGDYAGYVNYARKSPHRGWIDNQIEATNRVIESNINYDIYKEEE